MSTICIHRECEKLGLDLDEFLRIGIEALAKTSDRPEADVGDGEGIKLAPTGCLISDCAPIKAAKRHRD